MPISKMTNALVEISLISISVVLGLMGFKLWVVLAMVGISLSWWGFVHRQRLSAINNAGKAFSSFALAVLALAVGHFVAFGLGGAFHSLLGFK